MKIGVAILFLLSICPFGYAQFNSVSNDPKLNNVGLFVAPKKVKKTDVKTDTLLYASIKRQKESLANEVAKDTLQSQTKSVEPLIFLPLETISINSSYGYRYHPIDKVKKFHAGIDLQARNSTVYSIVAGVVESSGYSAGLGYFVKIRFNEYQFIYGHLSQYFVLSGDKIKAGQQIGKTGNSGKSTGEHLHFAVKKGNRFINPISFINQ